MATGLKRGGNSIYLCFESSPILFSESTTVSQTSLAMRNLDSPYFFMSSKKYKKLNYFIYQAGITLIRTKLVRYSLH